jgi:hypothetical protein
VDLFVYFRIVKIVMSIKTRDLVKPLKYARWFSSLPFQLVSKLQIKKQGGALTL